MTLATRGCFDRVSSTWSTIGGSRGLRTVCFEGEEAVLHVIERIVAPLGLRVDATSPWVDARLPDGSRVQTNCLCTLFSASSRRRDPVRLTLPVIANDHWSKAGAVGADDVRATSNLLPPPYPASSLGRSRPRFGTLRPWPRYS
jgi:hypothetical protein